MRYFDAQVGVREDLDSGPNRTWGAVGIQGLAPNFFEFSPTFYFRDGGNVAGRLEGSYDLRVTQRLVVQPQAELNFYSKSDPKRGTGSGSFRPGCRGTPPLCDQPEVRSLRWGSLTPESTATRRVSRVRQERPWTVRRSSSEFASGVRAPQKQSPLPLNTYRGYGHQIGRGEENHHARHAQVID